MKLVESFIGLAIIFTTVSATSRRELERAAELAVERAAEKVAERAAEKSLEEGNSTTLTVTVKEGYSNARKTAEEAAAPGSESTRPGNAHGNYYHTPASDEKYYDPYDVTTLFAPGSEDTENAGSWREYSMEGADGYTGDESRDSGAGDFDSDFEFDFDSNGDFETKRSDDGLFRKSYNSKRSVNSRSRRDRRDFDDYDGEDKDEKIFRKYEGLSPAWSTTSNDGWTRYRPLWDDDRYFGNGKGRKKSEKNLENSSVESGEEGERGENKSRGNEESGENEEDESERDEENEREDEEEEETRTRKRVRKRMSKGQERSRDEAYRENKFEKALENFKKSKEGKSATNRPSLQSYAKKRRPRTRERGQKEETREEESRTLPSVWKPITMKNPSEKRTQQPSRYRVVNKRNKFYVVPAKKPDPIQRPMLPNDKFLNPEIWQF